MWWYYYLAVNLACFKKLTLILINYRSRTLILREKYLLRWNIWRNHSLYVCHVFLGGSSALCLIWRVPQLPPLSWLFPSCFSSLQSQRLTVFSLVSPFCLFICCFNQKALLLSRHYFHDEYLSWYFRKLAMLHHQYNNIQLTNLKYSNEKD